MPISEHILPILEPHLQNRGWGSIGGSWSEWWPCTLRSNGTVTGACCAVLCCVLHCVVHWGEVVSNGRGSGDGVRRLLCLLQAKVDMGPESEWLSQSSLRPTTLRPNFRGPHVSLAFFEGPVDCSVPFLWRNLCAAVASDRFSWVMWTGKWPH